MKLTTEEIQIVELINSKQNPNLKLAVSILKGLKISQKTFFQKVGWSAFGVTKINDCLNPKNEIFILNDTNLQEYNKAFILPTFISTLLVRNYSHSTLPPKLPSKLKELDCVGQFLTTLPDNLPNSLIRLKCDCNLLTTLPHNLPDNLEIMSMERIN